MKKYLAVLLAVLLLFSATACGNDGAGSNNEESNRTPAGSVAAPQEKPKDESKDKPVDKEEQWVLVSEEKTVPQKLLTESEINNLAGRPYSVTKYDYDTRGNVILKLEEHYHYNSPDSKTTEYLREYDNNGELTHYKRTYSGTGVNESVTEEYYQNEYQNGKLVKKVITKGNVTETREYEYDDKGRLIREAYHPSNSTITTFYINEYEGDLLKRYVRENVSEDGSKRKVEYEKINEYDSKKNLVKITATTTYISRSETTVSVREFDDNGRVIKNKSTTTFPKDVMESDVYEVWTRQYENDGHSYTETSYYVTDLNSELTPDMILFEIKYQYLPLSKAIAQQTNNK